MEKMARFIVPDTIRTNDLISGIAGSFSVKKIRSASSRKQYCDTFDWRLQGNNLVLYRENRMYRLASLATGMVKAEAAWPSRKQLKFWGDLADGPLRDILHQVLDMRALLPRAVTISRIRTMHILNRDAKTVMHVRLERYFLAGSPQKPILTSLSLEPVRGYYKQFEEFRKYVAGLGLAPENDNAMLIIYNAAGLAPGTYSTKLDIHLAADQAASLAAVDICKSQLHIMKQNESGIMADIDCEFLHDFRVALRRTRAALSQLKNLFAPEITMRFKKELAVIGSMTNRLRDLDVYLLKRETYQAMLPAELRPKLDHLFTNLVAERRREYLRLTRKLKGPEYQAIMTDWETFLQSYEPGNDRDGKNAGRPVLNLARKYIFKSYAKVIKQGRKMGEDAPDGELHRLRLNCKKMRYLLEFFSSLFPADRIGILVKHSKKLQENLGDFNDLFVQQKALRDYLEKQVPKSSEAIDIAAAIGGLITNLSRKKQEVRQVFSETFKQFDHQENNRLFLELFTDKH